MTTGAFRTEDGCLLSYEDSGQGMPVLWQHGLGADRNQPAEVFCEMPNFPKAQLASEPEERFPFVHTGRPLDLQWASLGWRSVLYGASFQ